MTTTMTTAAAASAREERRSRDYGAGSAGTPGRTRRSDQQRRRAPKGRIPCLEACAPPYRRCCWALRCSPPRAETTPTTSTSRRSPALRSALHRACCRPRRQPHPPRRRRVGPARPPPPRWTSRPPRRRPPVPVAAATARRAWRRPPAPADPSVGGCRGRPTSRRSCGSSAATAAPARSTRPGVVHVVQRIDFAPLMLCPRTSSGTDPPPPGNG